MKKFAITLCFFMITQGAHAYIKEGNTANVRYLQGSGFSQSTLRIMDEQQERVRSVYEQYTPYYENEYYGVKHPGWWYQRFKAWFDPMQDDKLFGAHEINFSNKFFQSHPPLTSNESL